jgi:hypothetical protein
MIREELKQLKTDPRALRKFGLMVGGVLALLGLWCWLRHKPAWPYLLAPAAPLLVLGLAWPASLRRIYLGWMAMAITLGLIVSTVLLTLFFYLVITPVGLLARLLGRDFLSRQLDPKATSYWLARDRSLSKGKIDYERQF